MKNCCVAYLATILNAHGMNRVRASETIVEPRPSRRQPEVGTGMNFDSCKVSGLTRGNESNKVDSKLKVMRVRRWTASTYMKSRASLKTKEHCAILFLRNNSCCSY